MELKIYFTELENQASLTTLKQKIERLVEENLYDPITAIDLRQIENNESLVHITQDDERELLNNLETAIHCAINMSTSDIKPTLQINLNSTNKFSEPNLVILSNNLAKKNIEVNFKRDDIPAHTLPDCLEEIPVEPWFQFASWSAANMPFTFFPATGPSSPPQPAVQENAYSSVSSSESSAQKIPKHTEKRRDRKKISISDEFKGVIHQVLITHGMTNLPDEAKERIINAWNKEGRDPSKLDIDRLLKESHIRHMGKIAQRRQREKDKEIKAALKQKTEALEARNQDLQAEYGQLQQIRSILRMEVLHRFLFFAPQSTDYNAFSTISVHPLF